MKPLSGGSAMPHVISGKSVRIPQTELRAWGEGVVVGVLTLLVGLLSIYGIWQTTERQARTEFQSQIKQLAVTIATTVDVRSQDELRDPAETNTARYDQAVAPLRRALQSLEKAKFVYTAVLDQDKVRFVMDAALPGDNDRDGVEDQSPVWQEYQDPDEELLRALGKGGAVPVATTSLQPHADQWGTFLSGYAPIRRPDGTVAGILGIDIAADDFVAGQANRRLSASLGLIPAALLSLGAGLATVLARRSQLRSMHDLRVMQDQLSAERDRLELALESGSLGTWDWDLATGMVRYDERWAAMLGEKAADLGGSFAEWSIRVHPEDLPETMARVTAMLDGESATYTCVHRMRHADGGWRHILDRGRVVRRDSTGAPVRVVGTHQDVTAQQTYQAELAAAREAAESASAAKSEFLANMSHEIRTPMTAILGFADLLSGDPALDAETRRQHIDTIRRNGEHLLSLINDILDLSKIEAGKMQIERTRMVPTAIVHDVMSLMRVRAGQRGIGLEFEFATATPEAIESDPVRVRQVLVNLVGNAIKFTERGGVKLTVRHDAGTGEMSFEVRDTGIGLTPEQMGRLFGAFAQADASTTRKFGGTGLGLRISKRLAEMLGGDIEVSSDYGVGSVFALRMKAPEAAGARALVPAEAMSLVRESEPGGGPTVTGKPLSGRRILLAEDGPDNVRLIRFHLEKAGATVTAVENGRLAVEKLTEDGTVDGALRSPPPFDLLLTDMQMPEMDGYAAVRLLRGKGCEMPVVALTAHAMVSDADKCRAAGCDAYATKPINRDDLLRVCGETRRAA
jgi:PAS domain S-box-containing protein